MTNIIKGNILVIQIIYNGGMKMRLTKMKLKNFRCYKEETDIFFADNITVFIGKNDSGKSSIFDALDIFLMLIELTPQR